MECEMKQINISSNNKLISFKTWRYELRLNMMGTLHYMGLRDFRKMLTVIRNMIKPDDMADFLGVWDEFIQQHYDQIPRADKYLRELERQRDKLPAYIFEVN